VGLNACASARCSSSSSVCRAKRLARRWGVNGGSRSRHLIGGGNGRAERGIETRPGALTSGGPASGDWEREDETHGIGAWRWDWGEEERRGVGVWAADGSRS